MEGGYSAYVEVVGGGSEVSHHQVHRIHVVVVLRERRHPDCVRSWAATVRGRVGEGGGAVTCAYTSSYTAHTSSASGTATRMSRARRVPASCARWSLSGTLGGSGAAAGLLSAAACFSLWLRGLRAGATGASSCCARACNP